jgi:hypothetical protein
MKNLAKVFIISLFSVIVFAGCSNTSSNDNTSVEGNKVENNVKINEYIIDESDFVKGNELIKNIEKTVLNEKEMNGLVLMREEEKLARDVYMTLGEKWGVKIFSNISGSEQTHTDAIKNLLDRYGIEDPNKNDSVGVFTSEIMTNLYNDLVSLGEKSLLDALIVGVTIEDLDIKDLNELLEETDNADIITVYENLNRGSRNHLRAFMRQVTNNGGEYIAQYITQIEFDLIVASTQERGSGNGRGGRK